MKITKTMLMGEILETEKAEKIAELLMEAGMHCIGCPSSQMESLEDACAVHGIDCDALIEKINKVVS